MLKENINKNVQIALFAFSIGLISFAVLRKILKSKYKLPTQICFNKEKHLGKNKREFLDNLQKNHENYLI